MTNGVSTRPECHIVAEDLWFWKVWQTCYFYIVLLSQLKTCVFEETRSLSLEAQDLGFILNKIKSHLINMTADYLVTQHCIVGFDSIINPSIILLEWELNCSRLGHVNTCIYWLTFNFSLGQNHSTLLWTVSIIWPPVCGLSHFTVVILRG